MGVSFTVNLSSTCIQDYLTIILQMIIILSIYEKEIVSNITRVYSKSIKS